MSIDFANCLAGFSVVKEQLPVRAHRGKKIARMRESHILNEVGMSANDLSSRIQCLIREYSGRAPTLSFLKGTPWKNTIAPSSEAVTARNGR